MIKILPLKSLWSYLTGHPKLFSMENRAFNVVSIITFFMLVYCLFFDIFIGQRLMCGVILLLLVVQVVLFYFSRVKRKAQECVIVYAVCCYLALITNFYFNEGVGGPTLFLFFLTFQLLIAISPPRLYKFWITFHLIVVGGLLYSEYQYPQLVPDTYPNRAAHFLDIMWKYIAAIVFAFFVTNYLRQYYNYEKKRSLVRLDSIMEQNERILVQNEQLNKINEEKNKLFSIVSHDMRSPLDTLRGYLEILSENLLNPEEKKEIEKDLLEQVKYTSDLMQNLLYWSKTQMQGVTVQLTGVKLRELLDDACNFKMAGAAKKSIKITYNINDEVELIADKEMLRIVLRNLVTNAVKFTPHDGEIEIKLAQNAGIAVISIHDNGIGMPEEKQKEIFSLKTSSTYGTEAEKGVGLGLLLCKEFMTYQNGEIWFESKHGVGSVFYLSLPLVRAY